MSAAALSYLVALVESGVEYPDAEYRAAKKYQVPADDLRADYDHCSASGLVKPTVLIYDESIPMTPELVRDLVNIDFRRLGYTRSNLAPEVVGALARQGKESP